MDGLIETIQEYAKDHPDALGRTDDQVWIRIRWLWQGHIIAKLDGRASAFINSPDYWNNRIDTRHGYAAGWQDAKMSHWER